VRKEQSLDLKDGLEDKKEKKIWKVAARGGKPPLKGRSMKGGKREEEKNGGAEWGCGVNNNGRVLWSSAAHSPRGGKGGLQDGQDRGTAKKKGRKLEPSGPWKWKPHSGLFTC